MCLEQNLAVVEIKIVLKQDFSSIEMVEKVGDQVVVVDAAKTEKI
jgi:hypothetical protein